MENINKCEKLNTFKTISDEPLYVMTIELDEGKSSNVKIYLDSKPEELAFDFCKENNLDYSSMSYLSSQIKDLMDKFTNDIVNNQNECIEELDEEKTDSKRNRGNVKDKIIDKPLISNKPKKQYNKRTPLVTPKNIVSKHENSNSKPKKTFSNVNTQTLNKENHTLFSCESFFKRIKDSHPQKKKIQNNKSQIFSQTNNSTNNTSINTSKKIKPNKSFDNFNLANVQRSSKDKGVKNKEKVESKVTPEEKENLIKSLLPPKVKNMNLVIQKNTYTNFGERIYEKGMKMSEIEKKRIEQLKANLLKAQNEQNTFKPLINKNTISILKRRQLKSSNSNKSDNILNYKKVVDNKIQRLKEKYNFDENFDFKPKFNKKSIQMENRKKIPFKKRINNLYSSSKEKEKKLKKIENEMYDNYSFTPQFTEYPNGNLNNLSFEERQKVYRSRSLERLNKLIMETNEPTDKETGQELFHPYLYTSNSSVNVSSKRRNVFRTLYSYMNKYKMNKSQNIESITLHDNEKRNIKINKTSSKIFYNRKRDTFTKIFILLDRDNDNEISILNMDLKNLPPTIVNIIQPIIQDLRNKEGNCSITKREFIHSCMELFDTLSFKDKQTILNFSRHCRNNSATINTNFTFQPKINNNSKKICNGLSYFSSLTDNGKVSEYSYTKYLKHSTGENSINNE